MHKNTFKATHRNRLTLLLLISVLATGAAAADDYSEDWKRAHEIMEQHRERIRQDETLRELKKQTRLMEQERWDRLRREREQEQRDRDDR
jgi:hypothetical protein